MYSKIPVKILFVFVALVVILFSSRIVLAEGEVTDHLLYSSDTSSCDCAKAKKDITSSSCREYCGYYSLNDIVALGVKITDMLLALSGSVALLFFVYGGVTFLLSGGSSEKVSQGKQIIANATIGIIIIFTSFVIIEFSMETLGYTKDSGFGEWYQSN